MKKPERDFKAGSGRDIPPPIAYVRIYFLQQGLAQEHADFFYRTYQDASWKNSAGRPVKNWKTLACDWIWEFFQARKKRLKFSGKTVG